MCSTSELSTLLDTWRKEDQNNLSPVKTLHRLVKCIRSSIFFLNLQKNQTKKKTMIITPESFQVAASMQLVSFVNML